MGRCPRSARRIENDDVTQDPTSAICRMATLKGSWVSVKSSDKLSALRARTSPFKQKVKDEANTTWVKPKLVAEVKFTEWTDAGEMRHPAFLGLREDKRAEDVVREKEAVSKRR